ncbi:hypothetical protein E4T48_00344 [Aureobasidium sp. EXF-10727]|nr:hypothetical protein E4T48_00344 [Aureobasidium sp. EXF-10727]
MRNSNYPSSSSIMHAAARPVSTSLSAGLSFLARITFLRNTTWYQNRKKLPCPKAVAESDSPTMDIPFRAAEGVSRFFLFEALRTGCEEIGPASEQLESARDRAEKILVKESPVEFESLVEDILKSCAKSLQTHAAIVEAVSETVNGSTNQSDQSSKKLDKFRLLVGQIKDAAAGIEELRSANTKTEQSPPLSDKDFDSEPEVQSTKKTRIGEPEKTTLPKKKKKTKTKHASNTSTPVDEISSSGVLDDQKAMKGKGKKLNKTPKPSKESAELSSPSRDNMKEATEGRRPQTSPLTSSKSKHSDHNASTGDANLPPTTPEPAPANQTSIDEEDINAEVEARLAAKELKRAKKKQAKKRKRDSVASEIFSPDPKAEPEHRTVLPAKKKARVEGIDGDGKGKRQNVDDALGSKSNVKKQKTDVDMKKGETTVEANKPKRRRSSNIAVAEAPTTAPEARSYKKRRLGV